MTVNQVCFIELILLLYKFVSLSHVMAATAYAAHRGSSVVISPLYDFGHAASHTTLSITCARRESTSTEADTPSIPVWIFISSEWKLQSVSSSRARTFPATSSVIKSAGYNSSVFAESENSAMGSSGISCVIARAQFHPTPKPTRRPHLTLKAQVPCYTKRLVPSHRRWIWMRVPVHVHTYAFAHD